MTVVMTRGHHDPLKAAFHCFQNCSIPKAVNPKSSLPIIISKAQKPISKNRVLSLEIEKNFGNFFGLLPRDWTKIGGRFLTHHFKLKDRSLYLTNGTLYQNSMKWDLLGSLYGFKIMLLILRQSLSIFGVYLECIENSPDIKGTL